MVVYVKINLSLSREAHNSYVTIEYRAEYSV